MANRSIRYARTVSPVAERSTKSPQALAAGVVKRPMWLGAVVANSFNRAAFLGLFATRLFLWRRGLLENVRIPAVFVPLKILGCGLTAQIAVNALVVNVVLARSVLGIFICSVSHRFLYIKVPQYGERPRHWQADFGFFSSRVDTLSLAQDCPWIPQEFPPAPMQNSTGQLESSAQIAGPVQKVRSSTSRAATQPGWNSLAPRHASGL